MTNPTMADTTYESESLACAVAGYLAARYPYRGLNSLSSPVVQEDDRGLAATLYRWRVAAGWPQPHDIGESRCVSCHKIMGDELSACEDETVCASCGDGAECMHGNTHDCAACVAGEDGSEAVIDV